MSSHTTKIIHPMCSFLFGVIFLGAAAVGILTVTGVVVSVCEDVPSPNNITSLLQIENTLVTMKAQCTMENRLL